MVSIKRLGWRHSLLECLSFSAGPHSNSGVVAVIEPGSRTFGPQFGWAKLRVDRHSSAVRITCDMVEITGPNCLLLESKRSHLNQAVWRVISAITWNPNSSMQVPVPARNLVQFRNWQDTVSPLAATDTVMRPA